MESFYAHFERLTKDLLERSQDILQERFGVVDGKAKTLEEIGKKYRITRERVRQIIRSSLKDILARNKQQFQDVSKIFETTLQSKNGIMSETDFIATLSKGDAKEVSALYFFLESVSVAQLIKEDALIERSYALASFDIAAWKTMIQNTIKVLEGEKEAVKKSDLFKKYTHKHSDIQDMALFFDYIAVSKQIKENAFGKFGLSFWSDVSPKGTREKAYLVMKATGKPLHFREITSFIDTYGLNKNAKKKKTHPQTVHNELIKDTRFILVGRGIYALSEWGYAQGTVQDVIRQVFATHSNGLPMHKNDIIREVLVLRQVQKSTIVINLNTFFAKVDKDVYTLKQ